MKSIPLDFVLRDEALYRDAEAQAYLKCNRTTLAAWRAQGRLRWVSLSSRSIRYRGKDLREFVESRIREGGR
jgi:predicted site-specific integrase-resolvase